MIAVVSPAAYAASVALAASVCAALCIGARRHPGRWTVLAGRAIAIVLLADAISFALDLVAKGTWSPMTSLPLALCNMALLVAIAACWWRIALLVELTWFWGMAGTIQAVITPDLDVTFPHLVFFEYVVGHLGIVTAALFLVVGLRITPRPGAVWRTFGLTLGYTAFVGAVDAATGANYMFLREPPANWTLLRLLGPWPWYIPSAAAVALVLIVALDAPFRRVRRVRRGRAGRAGEAGEERRTAANLGGHQPPG